MSKQTSSFPPSNFDQIYKSESQPKSLVRTQEKQFDKLRERTERLVDKRYRKFQKEYCRKQKKRFIKEYKKMWNPYDFLFSLDMFMRMLNDMKEYFYMGANAFSSQAQQSLAEIQEVIALFDSYINDCDNGASLVEVLNKISECAENWWD